MSRGEKGRTHKELQSYYGAFISVWPLEEAGKLNSVAPESLLWGKEGKCIQIRQAFKIKSTPFVNVH